MRQVLAGVLIVAGIAVAPGVALADDPMPTIVTYELSKARKEALEAQRDPRRFWAGEIVTRIEDRKTTTKLAVTRPVTVEVSFVVDQGGHLVSQTVTRSSGIPDVDRHAVAVVQAAAPFPPMPEALHEAQLAFVVPLRFR